MLNLQLKLTEKDCVVVTEAKEMSDYARVNYDDLTSEDIQTFQAMDNTQQIESIKMRGEAFCNLQKGILCSLIDERNEFETLLGKALEQLSKLKEGEGVRLTLAFMRKLDPKNEQVLARMETVKQMFGNPYKSQKSPKKSPKRKP